MLEIIKKLEKEKENLHFLMKVNIWNMDGKVKKNFAEILKDNFNIDCNSPDALDKIINYGKQTKKASKITYKKMYQQAKKIYEENKDNYNYIGIRFENKVRKIGEICECSKANIDREDVRDYPDYGTKEYNDLPKLKGTCAYDLSDNRTYDIGTDRDNKLASSQVTTSHCYIVVGDSITQDFAEDEAEIIIENAKVIKQLF